MLTHEKIYQRVSATLADALNVDEDALTPHAVLERDLGAESIDYLDIIFRLEREFGIRIPDGELFPESLFHGNPEFIQNGKLTGEGLTELRVRMPFADWSEFEKDAVVPRISDLFTVDLVTRYIRDKLTQNSQ